MGHFNTIMNQLLTHLPRHQFATLAKNLGGDHHVRTFTSWQHAVILLYAQIAGKDSLRDIAHSAAAQKSKLYHLGLPDGVARSTLADANNRRDPAMFEGLFHKLLERCLHLAPRHKFRFKNPLHSIDATTIDLCLALFPWAKFRTTKGALKLHCRLDHAGHLPGLVVVTDGKVHDITAARASFDLLPDSIYCFDKGYTDFAWFRRIHDTGAFFVTRAKDNLAYRVVGQQEPALNKGVLKDAPIILTGPQSSQDYPGTLRLVRYYDEESQRSFDFLTNNHRLAASTIAAIYKARWQIEAFFKWIKQNLKIKTFLGTSKNAVLSQIWMAMCYYLLLAYIKFQSRCVFTLFYLHRLVQETLLDKLSLIDLLRLDPKKIPFIREQDAQLCLAI